LAVASPVFLPNPVAFLPNLVVGANPLSEPPRLSRHAHKRPLLRRLGAIRSRPLRRGSTTVRLRQGQSMRSRRRPRPAMVRPGVVESALRSLRGRPMDWPASRARPRHRALACPDRDRVVSHLLATRDRHFVHGETADLRGPTGRNARPAQARRPTAAHRRFW